MPLTTPILGITNLIVGSTTTLTNATPAGTWSSSDTSICTVVSSTGVVTTISVGSCAIIYTVGGDSISVTFTVSSALPVTNGFNYNNVFPSLQNRVLWKSQGAISDSQRYYEDFHALNNTQILDAVRPQNGDTLTQYLANKQRSVIMECLNAVYNAPQVIDSARLCFYRADVMLYPQPVNNVGAFVGIKMLMSRGDYSVIYNSVELYFNNAITFNLYLYNDFTTPPIAVIPVTTLANQQTIIPLNQTVISAYLTAANKGGIIYFGYFQDDIAAQGAQAIYYPINMQMYHPIKLWSYSAPTNIVDGQRNFVRNNIGSNNLTYGMNLEVSTYVDATNNIIQNNFLFDELFGLKMTQKNVQDIIFDYRSNNIQRILGAKVELSQLYAELNGFKADDEIPYIMGLKDQISREIKRVKEGFQKHETSLVGYQ